MKNIYIGCLTILLLGCSEPPQNPTDLLEANLEATGGERNWQKLRSLEIEEVTSTSINNKEVARERVVEKFEAPGFKKEESYTNDSLKVVTLKTPTQGYYFRFDNNKPVGYTVLEPEDIDVKQELELLERVDSLDFDQTVWNDREVFRLTNRQTKEEYIYDKDSFLLLAKNSMTPYGAATTIYQDYREKDGYHFAFKELTEVPSASYKVSNIISTLKINPDFDNGTFKLNKDWIVLKKGSVVPDFEIPLLGANLPVLKNSDLKGNIILLDFWATWCKPCIAEFPNIKDQYKKYKDSGFEVLSVSFDEDPTALKNYLEKNELPWINAWIKGGFKSTLAKDFQIASIPKSILVNKDGVILALDNEATGENLNQKLEKIFNSNGKIN